MKSRVTCLMKIATYFCSLTVLFCCMAGTALAGASTWNFGGSWVQNEDGSVTHNAGTGSIDSSTAIDGTKGFRISFDLTVVSAKVDNFSAIISLTPKNAGNHLFMRVKRSNYNWCAEPQFNAGSWKNLVPDEGSYGRWTYSLGDTVSVVMEHPAGSDTFRLQVCDIYASIIDGDVSIDDMLGDKFLDRSDLYLSVSTDNPDTDIFTVSNFSVEPMEAVATTTSKPSISRW